MCPWRCQQCRAIFEFRYHRHREFFVTCSIPSDEMTESVHMTKTPREDPEYRWQGLMEISENSALMYGRNFKKFPQKCSDCSRHGPLKSKCFFRIVHQASKKTKFVRTGPSGPENSLFSFGLAIRPQKRFAFPPNDNQIANCTEISHSASIPSVLPASPEYLHAVKDIY